MTPVVTEQGAKGMGIEIAIKFKFQFSIKEPILMEVQKVVRAARTFSAPNPSVLHTWSL